MNLEQLKRGKEIEEELRDLSRQKEQVDKMGDSYKVIFEGKQHTSIISGKLFDVELCKTLLVSTINKRKEELENEFNSL